MLSDSALHSIDKIAVTLEVANLPSLSKEGVVLVTGAGDVGQLGLGPDVLEKSRPALVSLEHEIVDVCAGGMHTVCLTKEGKVGEFTVRFMSYSTALVGVNFWM